MRVVVMIVVVAVLWRDGVVCFDGTADVCRVDGNIGDGVVVAVKHKS